MKLCQCKKDGLARAILSESKGVLRHEELLCNTIDMLENFCICPEKKAKCNSCTFEISVSEIPNNSEESRLVSLDELTDRFCSSLNSNGPKLYYKDNKNQWVEYKQTQSPCEHNCLHLMTGKVDLITPTIPKALRPQMFIYMCSECGLVTCKNPNE